MEYYIALPHNQKAGPFKKEALLANGLKPDSLVWREGLTTWVAAKNLHDLDDLFINTPPPLPQSPEETPPPLEITLGSGTTFHLTPGPAASGDDVMQQQLEQLNKEKEELKKQLEQKKAAKEKKLADARKQRLAQREEKKKQEEKEKKEKLRQAKKKTKYDYPVCDWRNESIWLLGFVVIHAALALFGYTRFFYIYLDIVGAILSIVGISVGTKIRKLNAISYKKGSESRLKAEPLGHFNGIFVSATAAIGFLIIFVQSAYYVYIC